MDSRKMVFGTSAKRQAQSIIRDGGRMARTNWQTGDVDAGPAAKTTATADQQRPAATGRTSPTASFQEPV